MSLTNFFKPKVKISTNNAYGLTPLGKTKAEEFALSGPKWEALAILNENGPSSVGEVAEELKCSPEKVRAILRSLIKSGYIRRIDAGD